MESNDSLIGKGSLKQKSQLVDTVTGVRKSYTCYEMGSTKKSNHLSVGDGSLKRKLQTVDSVTGVRKSYTCYEMG